MEYHVSLLPLSFGRLQREDIEFMNKGAIEDIVSLLLTATGDDTRTALVLEKLKNDNLFDEKTRRKIMNKYLFGMFRGKPDSVLETFLANHMPDFYVLCSGVDDNLWAITPKGDATKTAVFIHTTQDKDKQRIVSLSIGFLEE